jgi:hypothetical protein
LRDITGFETDLISTITQNNQNLTHFSLHSCDLITCDQVHFLLSNCVLLYKFTLSHIDNLTSENIETLFISTNHNLYEINILNLKNVTKNVIEKIIKTHVENTQKQHKLTITCGCDSLGYKERKELQQIVLENNWNIVLH